MPHFDGADSKKNCPRKQMFSRHIKNEQQTVWVCCSCFSDCKAVKSFSDFPHNVVRNDPLCFLVPEYGFSVMECDLHNCFHIKGNSTEQFIPCLLQCRRLNLWHDGGNLLFCYSLRNLFHFCPVFCGSAAVSILCTAAKISDFLVGGWMVTAYKTHIVFLLLVAGCGFGIA